MQASIKGMLDKFAYNGYVYNNVLLDARFDKGLVDATGSINDTSVRMQFSATANLHDRYPTVDARLNIDTLRLQALHFTDSLLDLSGKVKLRAINLQPHQLDASLMMDTFNIRTSTALIPLDSVSLVASSSDGIDSIRLYAPFARIDAGGNFEYDKLAASLQQYVRNYYQLPGKFETNDSLPVQQLAFNGTIIPHPVFAAVDPALKIKEVISLDGSFTSNAADSALNVNVKTAAVAYGDNALSNALFTVRSSSDLISNRLQFDTLQAGGNTFYQSDLNANLGQDRIYLNAATKDNKGKDWFGIKGYAALMEDVYRLRITDTVLLNHEDWIAASDNYIEYSPAGLVVNNFLITSDTAKIFIQSEQEKPNSPIAINIDNFNLSNLSSLVSSDTVFLSGILDVKARVDELDKPLPAFAGDATISGLMVENKPIGDIVMNAAKTDSNSIAATARLTGNNNDLLMEGKYYLADTLKQFDARLDIKQLNVKTIEALSDGMLVNSSGNLHGAADIYGRFDDPRWKGKLFFDTTRFTVAQLGSPYRIDNQSITFEYPKLVFDNLLIRDSLNHALKIDGNVAMTENGQMAFGLDLNANDFILLNSRKALSNQFFGFASVDANVSVTGTGESPKIEGDILVNPKSDITIILPETSYGDDDGNTIVRFIDADTFNLSDSKKGFTQAKVDKGSFGKYLFYNLNVEVNKDASLKIVVDPITGDEVQVRGDARLNAGVDPGGNLVLAGVYELDQGYYVLNYQFLQRKFNLLKGSTIVFAGAPQDADVNISAEYITNTTARDLLGNEITDVNPAMANALRQKLPFKVLLYVKGKLTKPEISFDIQLDATSNQLTSELKTTIESKLQQLRTDAAATNKQVFSLLLLGRFVGEQSSDFFKGNGADFTDIARQSVSQFLSSALNEIAGDIFKGIDVDLNLNSYNDFRTGAGQQRTDVNVAVSKSFFDERLTVTVGKNFGLEGEDPTAKASRNSSGFRPDVTVAYKLTRDGKYMIRAYTKNQFEVILDGYVVENGVSFVVTLDYDKFRELFRKPIKKN
ncbi:MAG: translocation/assembly module TamB domain-containing protein [Ferruginibacter sp.]